jgi:ABC-2 type transport system ATP-binding protein
MPTSTEPAPVALLADGVNHSFGATPALRDCSFTLPAGAVTALVGRNGAGKSTLLRAVVGLLRPDNGTVRVLGQPVDADVLPRIGFVAQQAPLYPMLTVAQTLRLGARLNPNWDTARVQRLVDAGALRETAKVGTLAAGERTRLAVAMALGKRPDLLVLDEPLASLDPVARVELLGTLMAEVAERNTTVLMSAHVIADIADVCDHVVLLGDGHVRLADAIESALHGHRTVIGPRNALAALDGHHIIELRQAGREFTALVRTGSAADISGADGMTWHQPTLDELLLGYLRSAAAQPTKELTPS